MRDATGREHSQRRKSPPLCGCASGTPSDPAAGWPGPGWPELPPRQRHGRCLWRRGGAEPGLAPGVAAATAATAAFATATVATAALFIIRFVGGTTVLTVGALLDAAARGVEAHRAPQVLRHPVVVVVDARADPPAAYHRRAAHGARVCLTSPWSDGSQFGSPLSSALDGFPRVGSDALLS